MRDTINNKGAMATASEKEETGPYRKLRQTPQKSTITNDPLPG